MGKVIAFVVIIAVVLGGGYYLYSHRGSSSSMQPSTATNTSATAPTVAQPKTFSGTLNDLIKLGGNYKCDWSYNNKGTTLQGTTYVSGNKFGGSGTANTSTGNMTVNEVGDGTTMYTWFNIAGTTVGTKMPYGEMQNASGSMTAQQKQQAQQAMQKFNYKCSPWIPDPSKFQVPTNVTFK